MKIWVVTLMDKEMAGEPDVGIAICEDEDRANDAARSMEREMINAGRCRCVASVRQIYTDRGYRIGSLVRGMRDR